MAGRIPQSFINDLIDRVDIVDVIESRMTLKKTGKNYSGLCPFHDEKTPSFSVSPDKQFYHCFGCQESGTALGFIMNFDRLEFVEAVEALAHSMGLEVPREQTGRGFIERDKSKDDGLYHALAQAEQFFRRSLRDAPVAVTYLKERGLTGEVARDFGIGYSPSGWQALSDELSDVAQETLIDAGLQIKNDKGRVYDRFRDRVMFPIRDTRGRVIGFGGRTLTADDGPKYLNSPETAVFHKGAELYGLYEARKALRKIDQLIVVEGYMDVVALAQHGVANAVATLGTASGEAHFNKLFRYADEVICCFDGDQAGRQAAWKALENALPTLNEHRQIKLAFLPDGEDPDSLIRARGKAGLDEFLDNAVAGLEFLFQRLGQGLDLDSIDGRARMAGLVTPYVERVPEGVLKTLMQQRVKQITGLGGQVAPQTPVHTVPRGPTAGGPSVANPKVSGRLLSILLKAPECWGQLPAQERASILGFSSQLGLLGELLQFMERHPQADTEELLIRWSDAPQYPDMLRSAQARMEISREQMSGEFAGGVAKLIQQVKKFERRAALVNLQDATNMDDLREYWRLRDDNAD